MPAFGLSAVPLPMKNRTKSAIGLAVAAATAAADGPTGSLLATDAAAGTVRLLPPPSSRRVNATAVHANGAAPGPSVPPPPSHASSELDTPDTAPRDCDAVRTGADDDAVAAAAGAAATPTDAAERTERAGAGADESDTSGASTDTSGAEPASTEESTTGELSTSGAACARSRLDVFVELRASPASAVPRPRDAAGASATSPDSAVPREPPAAGAAEPLRAAGREPRVAADFDAEPCDDESADAVEPPDPVVSAAATGSDATAAPTPRATARAPTRPTYRAEPDAAACCAFRDLNSIGRTAAAVSALDGLIECLPMSFVTPR